jgi:murein endopeptidase/LysM repeat protein
MIRKRVYATAILVGSLLPSLAVASPPSNDFDELPQLEDEDEAEPEPRDAEPEPAAAPPKPEPEPKSKPKSKPEPEPEPEATKPAAPKVAVKQLNKPKWIKHEVIPGERLDDIALRYDVRRESLIRWNKLDPDKPRVYAGRELAVYTKHIPPPQQKLIYTVESGDTWAEIAAEYGVDADDLRIRWNPKVPRKFKIGQEIVIWVDPMTDPSVSRDVAHTHQTATAGTSVDVEDARQQRSTAAPLPLVAIASGSISVGQPNRGKIVNSIALPENKALYTIRKPDESYGSSHALHNIQLAIANFRQATGYKGEIIIGAISKQGGGRLRPHSSHQSGRDVDIRLPLDNPNGSSDNVEDVDWDATWALLQALVATGEVQYIFLSTSRQKYLYKAAKRAGASKDLLERMIQYPRKSGTNDGLIRDESGHTAHFHVRFTCAANETRCESY